jgi:hypothetical protein
VAPEVVLLLCTCRVTSLALKVLQTAPFMTGLRRGPSQPTAGLLAVSEHTRRAVLRRCQAGDGRRSGAMFCARGVAGGTQNAGFRA